jgi:hypothetical protein
MFVESGTARVALPAARGKEAPPREAKAGDFVTRIGERALVAETRAAPAFVTAMPPSMRDALPRLAARYKVAPPVPPPGAEVSYAEAEPWLGGPYRRTFVRRLTPRLSDPAFRGSVEPHLAAYPEWDRVLHPEKYPVEAAVPRKP